MTENLCVRCARPMPDVAYACPLCATQAAQKLSEVAEMTPAARDVATGLSRRSTGGASGKPGSRLPLDLTATAKLDSVQIALTRWIDHTGSIRGTNRPWFEHSGDPIVIGAQWLAEQVEFMRHRPEADDFLTDVDACLRVVRGIARGPAEHRYLGPCGAPTLVDVTKFGHQPESEFIDGPPCDGDVYGRAGATNGTCRTCGATVDQAERRAWLDDEVRQRAFTAREIGDAYSINVKTIRSWHDRGLLAQHGADRDGRPLHNVGEVLDLAAADAARREENRAKRERRAARAAESERVA